MKFKDLESAIKRFRTRLAKNGKCDEDSIEIRPLYWNIIGFNAFISEKATGKTVSVSAEFNTDTKRLSNWDAFYCEECKPYKLL